MRQLNFLLIAFLFLSGGRLLAQQDAQYTQFMYNKLGFNPAFSGAVTSPEVRAIFRQQWLGFEDAPSSQIATFNTALSGSGTGIGARLSRVTVGLEQQYNIDGSYAYRFPVGPGTRLGLGISASARYFNIEYQNATPIQGSGQDAAIPGGVESRVLPNFGLGIYLDGPGYYVGVSVPRLLQNDIDLGTEETIISREARHFYFMGGVKFRLSEQLSLEPQLLAKYVIGAPFDADFNVTAYMGRSVFTGISYRLGGNGAGESASVLFGTYLSDHLSLCMAYDLGLSDLNSAQSGSVEFAVTYSFGGRPANGGVIDPREL